MELYQLRELAAFRRLGSISKAAEETGVSQPAASRAMKLLEGELGVSIFSRTSNSIELNETGKVAAEWATRISEMIQRATEEIRAADRRQKTILIGAEAPAPLWSVVSMLSSTKTDKTVAGEIRDRRILEDGLRNGTYSYTITATPITADGFSTVKLGEEHLMFLLPSTHRFADRKTLTLKDMDGENMILYEHIGIWAELPKRKMPSSKFFIQSDPESFEELVLKSAIPSFTTDIVYRPSEGKVAIPITDEDAHIAYYISSRSKNLAELSYLAKHFRAEFRKTHAYAF